MLNLKQGIELGKTVWEVGFFRSVRLSEELTFNKSQMKWRSQWCVWVEGVGSGERIFQAEGRGGVTVLEPGWAWQVVVQQGLWCDGSRENKGVSGRGQPMACPGCLLWTKSPFLKMGQNPYLEFHTEGWEKVPSFTGQWEQVHQYKVFSFWILEDQTFTVLSKSELLRGSYKCPHPRPGRHTLSHLDTPGPGRALPLYRGHFQSSEPAAQATA